MVMTRRAGGVETLPLTAQPSGPDGLDLRMEPQEGEAATGRLVQVVATDPPPLRAQHARRRRNHRIMMWWSVALLVAVLAGAGLVAAHRISRPLPRPTVTAGRLTASVVPGAVSAPPWPAAGQAAVAIPALGYAEQSGPETPVPIASLTKMTTALVVLRDHPVAAGTSGPTITITADEAAQFDVDLANDETNIPLQSGETLTEQQLLEALLVASANDAAYTLAVWDAGSEAAFVAKMNALAISLGATHSHYADASGFDPGSVSTAADTLRVAAAGMAIPAFASAAGMSSVTLPGVGLVHNVVTLIGTDGIVGVKSGYTSQAAGCMVLAGFRSVQGRSVLVLASALGQREPAPAPPPSTTASSTVPPSTTAPTTVAPAATTAPPYSAIEAQYPLLYTAPIVEHLLDAAEGAIVPMAVVSHGHAMGVVTAPWGSTQPVPVVATTDAWLLGVPGQRVGATLVPSGSARSATDTAQFSLGSQTVTVPVRPLRPLPDPGWWWKLLHN